MSENTPQRIGDYEIIRELGHGGMGRVLLARNVLSDRIEAMKIVLPDLAARGEFVARFMREIKVLASLDHPNIAALRTAFTAGDQFVMIMEYVEGVTLADRLKHGALLTVEALNYTDQVLAALNYAHGKHVIHRDIKPGNMMLTPQGVVKLMDFGLARSVDEVGLTMTGTTLGSLDYASPEQVKAQHTDERSDLYSVGVSLYQMVTGQRMFNVTSSYSIMQAQISETPRPPIEIVPTISKALNDVIMMAIAKDPDQRLQSAAAFQNALSQVAAADYPQPEPGQGAASAAFLGGAPVMAETQPPMDPGFTVHQPVQPASRGNRGLLLLVGVVLVAALVAGDAVYKSHQQRKLDQAVAGPEQPATSQKSASNAASDGAGQSQNSSPPQADVAQSPPAPSAQVTPTALPQPATTAQKAKAHDNHPPAPGPSAEEIQAQQQAALEHKKLLDAMETEVDQLDGRVASVESSVAALEEQMHSSGLGLRGDMVAARSNMRTDMAKAKHAMDSGDTERARQFLDMAHREVEKLETFLGRR